MSKASSNGTKDIKPLPVISRDQNKAGVTETAVTESLFTSDSAPVEETVGMGVADGALSILLDMLSDISANRGAYVLRETYSNALDAVRATGDPSAHAIRITLPTGVVDADGSVGITGKLAASGAIAGADGGSYCGSVSPLVVEDEGCGMTPDELRGLFLQYGGSAKRGDADAIGSKGLGSKAPLAISDSFDVVTRKGGTETHAVVTRHGGNGTARVTVCSTDLPDGTRVTVPVSDAATAGQIREAAGIISSWASPDIALYIDGIRAKGYDTGRYRSLGRIAAGIGTDGRPVSFEVMYDSQSRCSSNRTDDSSSFPPVLLNRSGYEDSVTMVIGGFPYDLPDDDGSAGSDGIRPRYRRAAWQSAGYVVIGEPGFLNFTPSRDDIRADAASKALYDAIIRGIKRHGIPNSYLLDRMGDRHDAVSLHAFLDGCSAVLRQGDDPMAVDVDLTGISAGVFEGIPRSEFVRDGHDVAAMMGLPAIPGIGGARTIPMHAMGRLRSCGTRVSETSRQWVATGADGRIGFSRERASIRDAAMGAIGSGRMSSAFDVLDAVSRSSVRPRVAFLTHAPMDSDMVRRVMNSIAKFEVAAFGKPCDGYEASLFVAVPGGLSAFDASEQAALSAVCDGPARLEMTWADAVAKAAKVGKSAGEGTAARRVPVRVIRFADGLADMDVPGIVSRLSSDTGRGIVDAQDSPESMGLASTVPADDARRGRAEGCPLTSSLSIVDASDITSTDLDGMLVALMPSADASAAVACGISRMVLCLAMLCARRPDLGLGARGIALVFGAVKADVTALAGKGARFLVDLRGGSTVPPDGVLYGPGSDAGSPLSPYVRVIQEQRYRYGNVRPERNWHVTMSSLLALTDAEATGRYSAAYPSVCDSWGCDCRIDAIGRSGLVDGTVLGASCRIVSRASDDAPEPAGLPTLGGAGFSWSWAFDGDGRAAELETIRSAAAAAVNQAKRDLDAEGIPSTYGQMGWVANASDEFRMGVARLLVDAVRRRSPWLLMADGRGDGKDGIEGEPDAGASEASPFAVVDGRPDGAGRTAEAAA